MREFEHVKPLVIRIDEIGRAQAVHYDALTYKPTGQAPELKYFLTQFVTKHFGRMRSTVKASHAESLFFLDAELAEAAIAAAQKHQTIETFLTSPPTPRSRSTFAMSRSRKSEPRPITLPWILRRSTTASAIARNAPARPTSHRSSSSFASRSPTRSFR